MTADEREDKRIDELAQATELGDDDLFVLQQQGEAKSLPGSVLKAKLGGSGGVSFTTDDTLTLDPETGVLSVNTADKPEADNTLPITSAAVYATVGNIEALLATI